MPSWCHGVNYEVPEQADPFFPSTDGRHAIAVRFANGAPVGPVHFGHAGFGVVHRDGKVRYADFAPQHSGSFRDKGLFTIDTPKTILQLGANGLPTKESLTALANELADAAKAPRESVTISYFATSDAETAAADAYYDNAVLQQKQGTQPDYWGGFRDCMNFCVLGLRSAGKTDFTSWAWLDSPNWTWWRIEGWADMTVTGTKKPDPEADRDKPHQRCPTGQKRQLCAMKIRGVSGTGYETPKRMRVLPGDADYPIPWHEWHA